VDVERRSKVAAHLRLLAFQFRALSTASPVKDGNGTDAERDGTES
jgi:hypothetical protein